jgi:hypothetical protein
VRPPAARARDRGQEEVPRLKRPLGSPLRSVGQHLVQGLGREDALGPEVELLRRGRLDTSKGVFWKVLETMAEQLEQSDPQPLRATFLSTLLKKLFGDGHHELLGPGWMSLTASAAWAASTLATS